MYHIMTGKLIINAYQKCFFFFSYHSNSEKKNNSVQNDNIYMYLLIIEGLRATMC